jgi:type II secretory pathway component GspD/PulD (secretin)
MRSCLLPLTGVFVRILLCVFYAGAVAHAQLAPLPDTARFGEAVSFRTGAEGEELGAMIEALARSVGLTAVTQGVPETIIRYDIGEPKPFREVWEIVLTLNGLEYVLRDSDIVVVGTPESLSGFQGRESASARAPITRQIRTYSVNGDPAGLKTFIESQFLPNSRISVTVPENLRLLVVTGTSAQQQRVANLLERFDQDRETPVRRAYTVSYARASTLAEVLAQTISAADRSETATRNVTDSAAVAQVEPSSSGAGAAEGESVFTFSAGDVSIASDPRTNQIIVNANTQIHEDIAELITQLDQPERQVNIQVRIQEVTTDMSERLGINLSAGIDRFATTLFSGDATSGLSFVFDAQRAITGFNLGAILDVFENQGLSRRVDDSNLTVLNNGTATLQSGGTIFISIAGAGSAENIEREIEFGVQLELTPQITNNNEVILDVNARVDNPIGGIDNPNLLQLTTRNLTSTVTLAPGQTVVLGGLLQNEVNDTARSVPGLSSVPVIGGLFSSSSGSESTTELLVIVTATVLE